jgi:hypothetical protein
MATVARWRAGPAQERSLQLLGRGAWADAELVAEQAAQLLLAPQRRSVVTAGDQGPHQQPVAAFVERRGGHQLAASTLGRGQLRPDSQANCAWLRRRGIRSRIARREIESSARLGRYRWRVERSLSWLSCWRRLPVRWDRDSGRWFAGRAGGLRGRLLQPALAKRADLCASALHQVGGLVGAGDAAVTSFPGREVSTTPTVDSWIGGTGVLVDSGGAGDFPLPVAWRRSDDR